MNNLSERVQREFEQWKEKYDIPYHAEFQVKTLLKLQEEYDDVEVGSNTTKTRETLLGMINRLHMSMRLVEKNVKYDKVIYVEYICKSENNPNKIIMYIDNIIYNITGDKNLKMNYFAKTIYDIVNKENAIIYISTRGFGISLYDELKQFKGLVVKELKVINI